MLIDTTNKKTVLNKEGTVAVGNLIEEGESYKDIFTQQKRLIDSLNNTIGLYKNDIFDYKYKLVPELKNQVKIKDLTLKETKEKHLILEENYKATIKRKNGNFWKGLGIGSAITLLVMLFGN